jgi:hypothetical protein
LGHLSRAAEGASAPLVAAIGDGLAAIIPAAARGFCVRCGFPLPDQDL